MLWQHFLMPACVNLSNILSDILWKLNFCCLDEFCQHLPILGLRLAIHKDLESSHSHLQLDEKKIAAAGNEQLQNEYSQQLALDLRNLVTNELFNDTYDQDKGYSYKMATCFLNIRPEEVSVSVMQDIRMVGQIRTPELVYFLVAEKPDLFLNNYNAYDWACSSEHQICNILDHTRLPVHRTTEAFNQAELNKLPTPTTPDDENGYKVSRNWNASKNKTAVDLIKLEIDYSSVSSFSQTLTANTINFFCVSRTSDHSKDQQCYYISNRKLQQKAIRPNIDPSAYQ
uniref:Uncharacterized protein n=1 Tax=Ditylenchus dipsaci TaxID=166011 RepID=A0A915DRX2_9BILA